MARNIYNLLLLFFKEINIFYSPVTTNNVRVGFFESRNSEFLLFFLIDLFYRSNVKSAQNSNQSILIKYFVSKTVDICKLCCDIGLDCMVEYEAKNPSDDPVYLCDLCMCRLEKEEVIKHLLDTQHKLNFFVSTLLFSLRKF